MVLSKSCWDAAHANKAASPHAAWGQPKELNPVPSEKVSSEPKPNAQVLQHFLEEPREGSWTWGGEEQVVSWGSEGLGSKNSCCKRWVQHLALRNPRTYPGHTEHQLGSEFSQALSSTSTPSLPCPLRQELPAEAAVGAIPQLSHWHLSVLACLWAARDLSQDKLRFQHPPFAEQSWGRWEELVAPSAAWRRHSRDLFAGASALQTGAGAEALSCFHLWGVSLAVLAVAWGQIVLESLSKAGSTASK